MAARTNKYTSVNFNDIYDLKFQNNKSSSSSSTNINHNNVISRSKTIISNSRIQGNMLVLTRPTPKPISIPPNPPPPPPHHQLETISLTPQGSTGTSSSLSHPPAAPLTSPDKGSSFNTNKFVPPHLRPGFVGKEEKILPPAIGRGPFNQEIAAPAAGVHIQGIYRSSLGRYGENGRPKSGGGGGGGGRGYDRMMRGGVGINSGRGGYVGADVHPAYFINRHASTGNRPNTSG